MRHGQREKEAKMIVSQTKIYYGIKCDICHQFTAWYDSSEAMAIEIAEREYDFVQVKGWPKGTMLCPACNQEREKKLK